MDLQRLEALEEQEGLEIALAGGIALEHRAQVRLGRDDQCRVGLIGLLAHLAHAHGPQLLVAELAGQLVGEGVAEIMVLQHRGVQEAREVGLRGRGVGGLVSKRRPHRGRRLRGDHLEQLRHDTLRLDRTLA